MTLLAIDYDNDEAVNFWVMDGDSYKNVISSKDGETHVLGSWPKKNYKGLEHFIEVMGKFYPETFFFINPVEVDGLKYDNIHGKGKI